MQFLNFMLGILIPNDFIYIAVKEPSGYKL